MRLVGVTSCPTGIAHSEMAAEALEVAAREKGHEMKVEVQGAAGDPPLDAATIAAAEAVVLAIDAEGRDLERFAHLPKIEVRTRQAIDRAGEIIDRAVAAAESRATVGAGAGAGTGDAQPDAAHPAEDDEDDVFASVTGGDARGRADEVRRWLMTGVSYMIPFVVAGGILIAAAFAITRGEVAIDVVDVVVFTEEEGLSLPGDLGVSGIVWLAAVLLTIGGVAFSMLVPILAGFIAYAMADRPGIAPGVVGGLLAVEVGAGFIGGLIAGLLAGALVNLLKKIPVTGTLKRMMPVLIYPLLGTLGVGLLMLLVVGEPIATVNRALESWLTGLSGANSILLGLIIGAMMAFDMGGPVNKVAYAFGILSLEAGNLEIMAAVMAAGMTPPLGLALASLVRKKLFTEAEQRAGQANWVMGASFITEGAIPFAAADPLRVIPSLMVGSATAGALSLAFGATLQAPHGGIWVITIVGNALLYLVAIAIGTVVTAAAVIALKSIGTKKDTEPATAAHATA